MDYTVLSILHEYHSLLQITNDLDFWSTSENKYYAGISVLFAIDNPSYIKQNIFPNNITVYSFSHVQRAFVFAQMIL